MTIEEIVRTIQSRLSDAEVYVQDLTGAGNHFEAVVVSTAFEGQSRIAQQRLVMDLFSEAFKGPLHALALKTYTPQAWAKLG